MTNYPSPLKSGVVIHPLNMLIRKSKFWHLNLIVKLKTSLVLGLFMADEKIVKSLESAEKLLNNGDAEGCLAALRKVDPQGENATTLRIAGEATWALAKGNDSKSEYRKAASLLRDSVKKNPKNRANNNSYNNILNEMQNKGIKETTLPRLINDGTPTLAGIAALVGVIVIALVAVKVASSSTTLVLPDEAELTISWNDGQVTKTEKIVIELYPDDAPVHVENLYWHATNGNYDNTFFHRVIGDNENTPEYDPFMIQGGDFQFGNGGGGYAAKWFGYCNGEAFENSGDCSDETQYTLPDEANNGLIHEPCTISMAKTTAPHTGGSQFFLIPQESKPEHLDGVHTVFGQITSGCEFVNQISEVETGANDVPVNPVTLVSMTTNGGESDAWWNFW